MFLTRMKIYTMLYLLLITQAWFFSRKKDDSSSAIDSNSEYCSCEHESHPENEPKM